MVKKQASRFRLFGGGVLLLLGLLAANLAAAGKGETQQIKALIKAYEQALNSSDVDSVLRVYARDGVFMPAGKPTSGGHPQVKTAYEHVFAALDFDIVFNFEDIAQRGDMATVRTVSGGRIQLKNEGKTIDNHTRELFVLHKTQGQWKIAQYMFNSMGPQGH